MRETEAYGNGVALLRGSDGCAGEFGSVADQLVAGSKTLVYQTGVGFIANAQRWEVGYCGGKIPTPA
jgi:hypothetical protein